jgi:hypothetical protein
MGIIIYGKSECSLCKRIINQSDKTSGYPAFLPNDHKYGRFSDAIFHRECLIKDPDYQAVEDMSMAYQMIIDSRPRNLTSVDEMDAWTKDAFEDWPPANGVVIFQPLSENDSEGGFWMDADQYDEMCKAEEEQAKKQKELREYHYQLERESWRYIRDDD